MTLQLKVWTTTKIRKMKLPAASVMNLKITLICIGRIIFTAHRFKYRAQLKCTQTHIVIQAMKTLNGIIPPVH